MGHPVLYPDSGIFLYSRSKIKHKETHLNTCKKTENSLGFKRKFKITKCQSEALILKFVCVYAANSNTRAFSHICKSLVWYAK